MEGRTLQTWKRRTAVVALVAVIGATVYGDNRSLSGSGLAAPVAGAIRAGGMLGHWASAAASFASLGVLYGTVLSRLDPSVRRSVIAAIDGVREVCTGRRAAPALSRCAAAKTCPPRPPRCARA